MSELYCENHVYTLRPDCGSDSDDGKCRMSKKGLGMGINNDATQRTIYSELVRAKPSLAAKDDDDDEKNKHIYRENGEEEGIKVNDTEKEAVSGWMISQQ